MGIRKMNMYVQVHGEVGIKKREKVGMQNCCSSAKMRRGSDREREKARRDSD